MKTKETNLVDQFVSQVIAASDYTEIDRNYLVNQVVALVGDAALNQPVRPTNELVELAPQLAALTEQPEQVSAALLNLITPAPSVVVRRFWREYHIDAKQAIANFYALMKANNYIQTKAIAKNEYFCVPTDFGKLEITINLSKPEKDPKAIAKAATAHTSNYPQCQLCPTNEGYFGRADHPARSNLRIIPFKLGKQTWGMQYSPYAYFNEHCIFLDERHEPMKISSQTFTNLLTIIQKFPGYFVGSNADLPIVGGSILSHEHYQGGRHHFAMEAAPITTPLHFAGFDDVQAGIVKWPLSVIRLTSSNQDHLVALADQILQTWRNYSDASVDVRAMTGTTPHHTITPIARMTATGLLQLDLVLRDNQTSAKYPDGIFHPHPQYHHIKKENIGLIEVMGLAVLPPRLHSELAEVAKALCGKPAAVKDYHQPWLKQLQQRYGTPASLDQAQALVKQSVGTIFAHVLENAGVFKQTDTGQAAFMRFVAAVKATLK